VFGISRNYDDADDAGTAGSGFAVKRSLAGLLGKWEQPLEGPKLAGFYPAVSASSAQSLFVWPLAG
jgi:hypothetical protein